MMNEQQTQLLLSGMLKLMAKMATALSMHEARIRGLEDDDSEENLAAFELMPLVEAMSQQLDAAYPQVEPTV